ncbi:MAG: pilus assembly FimT family protein [Patescibacteria group bacterium]
MKNKSGFTLIEMMTSIAMIIMVTAIFVANYKSGSKRTDITMTAQKLVADIHLAQNNTLGLVKYGNEFPSGGWGVNFDLNSFDSNKKYTIFADLNYPDSTEPGQETSAQAGYMSYEPGEGEVALGGRVVDLPSGIIIDSMTTNYGPTSLANVTFLPPDPTTNIFDGVNKGNYLTIVLKDITENITKTVRVNFLGLVEVVD